MPVYNSRSRYNRAWSSERELWKELSALAANVKNNKEDEIIFHVLVIIRLIENRASG